ncbi:MAG: hypothetical protein R2748_26705 [Bryobacterales bacterium]
MKRALQAALLLAAAAFGYTPDVDAPGQPQGRRQNVENLVFTIDASAAAGQTNSKGETIVTPGSDPVAAIRAAAESWNAIADSRVNFAQFDVGSRPSGRDDFDVITFRDTPEIRDIVGDATAVTSFFFNPSTNIIIESDILFNPELLDEDGALIPFSTTGEAGAFDIQATVAHELGHAIGAKHSSVAGSTMWQNGREGELFARTLTPDDELFAIQAYPRSGASGRFGRITGMARFENGSPIRGGLATAVSANGAVVSALTDLTTGRFEIWVPVGDYLVYLDPANDPLGAAGLTIAPRYLDTSFATTLYGGNTAPQTVTVAAGSTVATDLTAPAGDPPLEIRYVGVLEDDGFIRLGTGPREIAVNAVKELFLWGPGLGSVQEADIRVLGPNLRLLPGSVRVSANLEFEGFPALRLTVRPVAPANLTQSLAGGSLGTVLVTRQGMAAAYTGGIVLEDFVLPGPSPAFSSGAVTNAASFQPGPVAPGEIVSIFGVDMGPAAGMAPNAPSLSLPTTLGQVRVTFDGIPAPLFFVSANQINAQVPFEVAGRGTTTATIFYQGRFSQDVDLSVAPAAPGVFTVANQDGSLNSAVNPEARGRALIVYVTGQGEVAPAVATGRLAPSSPRSGLTQVSATIGGQPATPLFAGLTPGFAGLAQVNLLIPDDTPTGPATPLTITLRGVSTQSGVTVAIAP